MWHRLFIIGLLVVATPSWGFSGRVQEVELNEYTQFTLPIVPRLGTRLVFPFLLDDTNLKPPLNYKLTNAADFTVTRDLSLLAGQNVFLITCLDKQQSIGKLYMSIGGYNLAINLMVTNQISDHISDVFLVLGEDDREFLINHALEKAKHQLENLYRHRQQQDQGPTYEEVANLMLKSVKRRNIKQLYVGGKEQFHSADIFLDRFIYQPSLFYGLHFWLEHYDTKFNLTSVVLRFEQDRGIDSLIEGHFFCFAFNKRLDQCLYITYDELLLSNQGKLLVTLTNDKDETFNFVY